MKDKRDKKITKKQQIQLDTFLKNKSLAAKAEELRAFIYEVIAFLSTRTSTIKKVDKTFINVDIKNTCIELAQKGYPAFWGSFKRINGEDYWKKRLIDKRTESNIPLKPFENDILNTFINCKGNSEIYISEIDEASKIQKTIIENSIPLFSSKSEKSIVDINWHTSVKTSFWRRSKEIKLKFKELAGNKLEIEIAYDRHDIKTIKCSIEVKKNLKVLIKSELDNGKTLHCIIDANDKWYKTARLHVHLNYKPANINGQFIFFNKDIFVLPSLGIISHLSTTIKTYLPDYNHNYNYKEMAYYFDQISKIVTTKHNSPASSLLGNRIKLLSVIPYSFYFSGFYFMAAITLFYPHQYLIQTIGLVAVLCYILLAENILLIKLMKNAHVIENHTSAIQRDMAFVNSAILIVILIPFLPSILFFYMLRSYFSLNYHIAFFRSRTNILIRRLLSLGLAVMPWVHLVRKKWLYKNLSELLNKIKNRTDSHNEIKPLVVSIGSGFDWLLPYKSKNQEYKKFIFAEADVKSVISVKSYIQNTKNLFINDTFNTSLKYIPININKQGIKPVLSFRKQYITESNGIIHPLVLVHDGFFCYQAQKTINMMFNQMKKLNFPIFIIGDWEIYKSVFNHQPEMDKGLFNLFKDFKQRRYIEENKENVSKERYQGKFNQNDFQTLVNEHNFKIINPSNGNILSNCDEEMANSLLKQHKKNIEKKYFWPYNKIYSYLNIPTANNFSEGRNMGFYMVLANNEAIAMLGNNTTD